MPLSGIKVVEMTQMVLGPVAGSVLSEWGADVIKIENPAGGDMARGIMSIGATEKMDINPFFELCNHNKRGICLDLKQEEGREIAHKLVKQADVFISNMLPKTLRKMCMDYGTLNRLNPRLIYAEGTGYGLKGAEREKPAFDDTAFWARGGFMSILGEPDSAPPLLRGAEGDLPTALSLVCGILLALIHRENTGLGQIVNASLLGSGVWANAGDIQGVLISGRDVPKISRKSKTNPLNNIYETKDHRWIQLCMPQTDPYWSSLCHIIHRDDLINDPRFETHEKRCLINNLALISILDEVIAQKTVEELASQFDEEGIIWGLASTLAEVASDPQVLENEYIRDIDYTYAGRAIKLVVCPVKLSNIPKRDLVPAPELGQHTEEILLELGYSWDQISTLKEYKAIP